jgi:hypothetical protein
MYAAVACQKSCLHQSRTRLKAAVFVPSQPEAAGEVGKRDKGMK